MSKARPIDCPYLMYYRYDRLSVKCSTSYKDYAIKLKFNDIEKCHVWVDEICKKNWQDCPYYRLNELLET